MELVDLKVPKKSKAEMMKGTMPSPMMEQDTYPYGLRISFNEGELSKMGELFDDAEVGEKVKIVAEGKIDSKRASDSTGTDGKKKKNRSLEIQITGIHVECKSGYDRGTMADFMAKRAAKK